MVEILARGTDDVRWRRSDHQVFANRARKVSLPAKELLDFPDIVFLGGDLTNGLQCIRGGLLTLASATCHVRSFDFLGRLTLALADPVGSEVLTLRGCLFGLGCSCTLGKHQLFQSSNARGQ